MKSKKSTLVTIQTRENEADVLTYLENLSNEKQRSDSKFIIAMMEEITNFKPKMWGKSLIGFGNQRYKRPATGREVEWFILGYAPRKSNLSIHLISMHQFPELLSKLGKYKSGAGCLYINKLDDIDQYILKQLIKSSFELNQSATNPSMQNSEK